MVAYRDPIKTIISVFCLSLVFIAKAFAVGSSGFEIGANSADSLSRSNAVVADPRNPSTIAFNPAGLTELDGMQATSGASFVAGSVSYEGSRGQRDEDSSQTVIPVPYTYFSTETPIENLHVGFGANAMFGLMSKYDSQGSFKYIGFHNEMKTKGYHLSGAYKISEEWSIGIGGTYLDASVKQVGKYNVSALSGVAGMEDGDFELEVEGDGYGWNGGILYTPNLRHSFGLFYRSIIRTRLDGTLSSDNMGILSGTFGGSNTTTSADTDIKFPDNITIGYQYSPTDKLSMELDLGWTGWSSFDRQSFVFERPNPIIEGLAKINRDFRDVLSVNTGLTYKLSDDLDISGGYYFYQMSANKNNYSPDVPDGHRHGLTLGFQQQIKENLTMDLVYLFTFTQDTEIENNVGQGNGANIDGTYSTATHLISAGFTYRK